MLNVAPLPPESRVYDLVKSGLSDREIATALGVSEEQVSLAVSNLLGKLGLSARLELILLAYSHPSKKRVSAVA
jgi:DNA-binding NarL/FixJ family response regulator